ncbi:hypothetical protein CERSUDRAFT_115601, partial [Gelatoporia subvermispora B]
VLCQPVHPAHPPSPHPRPAVSPPARPSRRPHTRLPRLLPRTPRHTPHLTAPACDASEVRVLRLVRLVHAHPRPGAARLPPEPLLLAALPPPGEERRQRRPPPQHVRPAPGRERGKAAQGALKVRCGQHQPPAGVQRARSAYPTRAPHLRDLGLTRCRRRRTPPARTSPHS